MGRAVLIVAVCALLTSVAATAATTPTSYRARVNAICRAYNPVIKREEAAGTAAQKANDGAALGIALGHVMRLGLDEDHLIETTAVPSALRSQMAPILSILKQEDAHIRNGFAKMIAGDEKGMDAEFAAGCALSQPLKRMFDAAGLHDCANGA